jgi:hypothetical protein
MRNPFRYFNSSPEVIRLTVMMYIRYPLSLRQVEDILFERGIDICHETIRFWWNRFGPMFANEIRKGRLHRRSFSQWRWHLDEVFVSRWRRVEDSKGQDGDCLFRWLCEPKREEKTFQRTSLRQERTHKEHIKGATVSGGVQYVRSRSHSQPQSRPASA